jgi:hypothetical protein
VQTENCTSTQPIVSGRVSMAEVPTAHATTRAASALLEPYAYAPAETEEVHPTWSGPGGRTRASAIPRRSGLSRCLTGPASEDYAQTKNATST